MDGVKIMTPILFLFGIFSLMASHTSANIRTNKYDKVLSDRKPITALAVLPQMSRVRCADRCSGTKKCNSFSYRKGGNGDTTCSLAEVLNHKTLKSQVEPYEGHTFYMLNSVVLPVWELIFKGSKGIGKSIYDLWTSREHSFPEPEGARLLDDSCGCHYKSPLVENWDTLKVRKVKFALYADGEEVLALIFNGVGSNKTNWFSHARLEANPWTDLKTTTPSTRSGYFFSIKGDANEPLRFFVNYGYGGCHVDNGWLGIQEGNGGYCDWNQGEPWPAFMYSALSTKATWSSGSTTGLVNTKYGLHQGITCGSDCPYENLYVDISLADCALQCSDRAYCMGIEYSTHADVLANKEYCKILKSVPTHTGGSPKSSTAVYWRDNGVRMADAMAIFIQYG